MLSGPSADGSDITNTCLRGLIVCAPRCLPRDWTFKHARLRRRIPNLPSSTIFVCGARKSSSSLWKAESGEWEEELSLFMPHYIVERVKSDAPCLLP